jgi:hypothetical protein
MVAFSSSGTTKEIACDNWWSNARLARLPRPGTDGRTIRRVIPVASEDRLPPLPRAAPGRGWPCLSNSVTTARPTRPLAPTTRTALILDGLESPSSMVPTRSTCTRSPRTTPFQPNDTAIQCPSARAATRTAHSARYSEVEIHRQRDATAEEQGESDRRDGDEDGATQGPYPSASSSGWPENPGGEICGTADRGYTTGESQEEGPQGRRYEGLHAVTLSGTAEQMLPSLPARGRRHLDAEGWPAAGRRAGHRPARARRTPSVGREPPRRHRPAARDPEPPGPFAE